MLFSSLVAVAASISFLPIAQAAKSCAVFDAQWNLYVFGGSEDVNLGNNLGSPSPKPLPTSGRPDYGTDTLSCHLSEFNNAIYLLGASSSSPTSVYIFDAASSSWSTQSTSGNQPPLENSATILDHDTNVFFTLHSGNAVSQLDFGNVKSAAESSPAPWDGVTSTPWTDSSYKATIGLASNQILAFGAPDVPAGSADIFTVHYALWQNSAQAFPTQNGGQNFPSSHGQAASFFRGVDSVQYQMAYVPDDASNTYLLTFWTSPSTAGSTDGAPDGITPFLNTTQLLPAPTSKDTQSSYAASDLNLVQLTSSGELYYLDALTSQNAWAVKSDAAWNKMSYTASGLGAASGSSSASSSSAVASGSSMMSASGSSTRMSGSATTTKSAVSTSVAAASSSAAAAAASASNGAKSAGSREVHSLGSVVGALVLGAGALFLL